MNIMERLSEQPILEQIGIIWRVMGYSMDSPGLRRALICCAVITACAGLLIYIDTDQILGSNLPGLAAVIALAMIIVIPFSVATHIASNIATTVPTESLALLRIVDTPRHYLIWTSVMAAASQFGTQIVFSIGVPISLYPLPYLIIQCLTGSSRYFDLVGVALVVEFILWTLGFLLLCVVFGVHDGLRYWGDPHKARKATERHILGMLVLVVLITPFLFIPVTFIIFPLPYTLACFYINKLKLYLYRWQTLSGS